VTMQRRIRQFVEDYNQRTGATVLLTSHYMADVEALCKRVIVIHNGKLLFDGELSALLDRFSAFKTIGVTLANGFGSFSQYGEVLNQEAGHVTLRIPRENTPEITARILAEQQVAVWVEGDIIIDRQVIQARFPSSTLASVDLLELPAGA
jgi:ABC-2 type transport system ATP-binding protein